MDRRDFRANKEVAAFVEWAGKFEIEPDGHIRREPEGASSGTTSRLAMLPVKLAIPSSRQVPTPISGTFPLQDLTRLYQWRAQGMTVGDFAETSRVIAGLSYAISAARTPAAALVACDAIRAWGGDRNSNKGAGPFLLGRPDIVAYLDDVKKELALSSAIVGPSSALSKTLSMNSMLTKVHAFNAGDGLPIYDSRVAGAIATIVETWRQDTGRQHHSLPLALSFPAVGGGGARRQVRCRYRTSVSPGTVYYTAGTPSPHRAARNTMAWVSGKVRLGWLLSELLSQPSPAGIRSLEACLFMAGYDCAGINRT
jgi:hypothetical protein